jgi:thioredoxin 1
VVFLAHHADGIPAHDGGNHAPARAVAALGVQEVIMGRQSRTKKQRREGVVDIDSAEGADAVEHPRASVSGPVHTTDANFDAEVLGSDRPVLVDFWAPWCGPCKALGPVIDELAESMGDELKVVKYNTQQSSRVAQAMGIRSIPTMVLFVDGEVADLHVGAMPAPRLREWIDKTIHPRPSLWTRLFGSEQAQA